MSKKRATYHIEISFRDTEKLDIILLAISYEIESNVLRIENTFGEFVYYPLDNISEYRTQALTQPDFDYDVDDTASLVPLTSDDFLSRLKKLFFNT